MHLPPGVFSALVVNGIVVIHNAEIDVGRVLVAVDRRSDLHRCKHLVLQGSRVGIVHHARLNFATTLNGTEHDGLSVAATA